MSTQTAPGTCDRLKQHATPRRRIRRLERTVALLATIGIAAGGVAVTVELTRPAATDTTNRTEINPGQLDVRLANDHNECPGLTYPARAC